MGGIKTPAKDLSAGAKWFTETFNVSRETRLALETYEALLVKWQKSINLVGPSTIEQFWQRHAADSAQLLALAPSAVQNWLDIGAGGGFPGLVIAILWHGQEGRCVHLIESDQRKCAFMRTVIRETGCPATVHEGRIEDFAKLRDDWPPFDVISARALAPLPKLLELAAPFYEIHTKGLFLKGKGWEEELTQARQLWKVDCDIITSRTDTSGRILICDYPQKI
ncbi:MAG: 16S rRNA (guanine(527)-N(7))-methyltransferase RsmG [Parvibaculales bacterium]